YIPIGEQPRYIVAEELNGDGIEDLAVAIWGQPTSEDNYPAGVIEVLYSNGSTTIYDSPVAYSLGNAIQPTCIDFRPSGSGYFFMAVSNKATNDVVVLKSEDYGTADVSFVMLDTVEVGCSPAWLAVIGSSVVVANEASGSFSYLIGTGWGTFTAVAEHMLFIPEFDSPKAIASAGDQDNDGSTDIFVLSHFTWEAKGVSATILYTYTVESGPKFSFYRAEYYSTDETPFSLATGDFDQNGRQDAAIGFATGSEVYVELY
ncbi:MAG: VCBS repeat-containing protein, partial [Phycisphaerales bacterium]